MRDGAILSRPESDFFLAFMGFPGLWLGVGLQRLDVDGALVRIEHSIAARAPGHRVNGAGTLHQHRSETAGSRPDFDLSIFARWKEAKNGDMIRWGVREGREITFIPVAKELPSAAQRKSVMAPLWASTLLLSMRPARLMSRKYPANCTVERVGGRCFELGWSHIAIHRVRS